MQTDEMSGQASTRMQMQHPSAGWLHHQLPGGSLGTAQRQAQAGQQSKQWAGTVDSKVQAGPTICSLWGAWGQHEANEHAGNRDQPAIHHTQTCAIAYR
jgi:hypothetical protein